MKKSRKLLTPHESYVLGVRRKALQILIFQLVILVAFFAIWEGAARLEIIDDFITSSPSRIISTIKQLLSQDLFKHIGITLLECICGFILASIIGTLIAIVLWWFETLRKILEPFIIVLNSLPKIALGPIIIVWVGAGYQAIIAMTVLICIIVTIISVLNGFISCDDGKILLMKSMGANKLQILTKLILPYSIPNFISVLKINVGLAWVGVIMGEYLVSSAGLGYLIIYGSQVFKLDLVMTSTVILCILAAGMYLTVSLIEKRIKRSR